MVMQMKKVTMKDIANKLNISQNTVSLALRNSSFVKKETHDEIVRTAIDMGYYYSNAEHNQQNICIFAKSDNLIDSYFYVDLQRYLQEKLRGHGYGLLVNNILGIEMKSEQLKTFFDMNYIKGVVILGDIEFDIVEQILECNVPFITAGFYYYNRFTDSVLEENISAGYQAIKQLVSRNYRKIGFVGNPFSSMSYYERYLGYWGAVQKFGVELNKKWQITDFNAKNEAMIEFFASALNNMDEKPEAFFCASDKVALFMIRALNKVGLRVPEDIGIIGFDDSDLAKTVIPRLATFNPNNEMQAESIIRILLSRINESINQPTRVIVPIKWVEGGSIRKL